VSAREYATHLLLLATLAKKVKAAEIEVRLDAATEFDRVGVRDVGIVNDEQIGHVRVVRGSKTASVVDPAAFLAWAQKHHPEAVETVEQVRPDVQARWLNEVKLNGGVLDEATGELAEPDGVRVWQGDRKLVVAPSKDAGDVIARAIAANALTLMDFLVIEVGEPE
jgi:hypothetical protein